VGRIQHNRSESGSPALTASPVLTLYILSYFVFAMTAVTVILAPFHGGIRGDTVGAGPLRLMDMGLVQRLAAATNVNVCDLGEIPDCEGEVGRTFEVKRRVANAVSETVRSGRFPLVLAGNCNAEVGTFAGLGSPDVDVIWFDGHTDFYTPVVSGFGHAMYEVAVRAAFKWDEVHWAMLVKQYGTVDPDKVDAAHRYSPPVCTGALKLRKIGRPDPDLVSTSYVERSNLTLRMQQRRFTRLTNAFSKKAENHAHAVSLFFLYYNYCRPHQSLAQEGRKVTPAMVAGLTNRVWTVDDIVALMDPETARIGGSGTV
jgi:Arginase family